MMPSNISLVTNWVEPTDNYSGALHFNQNANSNQNLSTNPKY